MPDKLNCFEIFYLQKHFLKKTSKGEILIRSQTTTLLQIFGELVLHFQVIFKSMNIADATCLKNKYASYNYNHGLDSATFI